MRRLLLIILCSLFSAVPLLAQVSASFTATPTSGCSPMVVSFTNTSTGATSYSWSFGNSTSSTATNPTTSYLVSGTYTVTLTATSGSSSSTATTTITVRQPPSVLTSSSSVAVCPGTAISFTSSVTWNTSGGGTYLWDFGDGSTSTAANPTHAWSSGGTYRTVLTATNSAGCPTADTILITVYPKPHVTIQASDTAVCSIGGATTFTTTGSGTFTYAWNFGDGTISSSSPPVTHNYYSAGFFTPRVIVTDANGCSDTAIRANYIRVVGMAAGMSAPPSACVNAGVTASSTSTTTLGSSITWNFGDGTAVIGGSPAIHGYLTSGTYMIVMTAVNGGCTAHDSSAITINAAPSPAYTYSPAVPCPSPTVVSFSDIYSSTATYAWDFGDGTTGSSSNPYHTFTRDTLFDVKLTVTGSTGCSLSQTQTITIRSLYGWVIPDSGQGCVPHIVSFIDSLLTKHWTGPPGGSAVQAYPQPAVSWSWTFGDGSSSTAQYPIHTYTVAGSYLVSVTATTANGCSVTDTVRVRYGTRPTANFSVSKTTACVNDPISFNDQSTSTGLPVNGWNWDFGAGGGSSIQNPREGYSYAGTYTVTLIASVNGCKDTIVKPLLITINWPRAQMRSSADCDTPGLVHFVDTSISATSHIFFFGDGTSSTASRPGHQYLPGIYTAMIVAYNSTTGCTDTMRATFDLRPISVSFTASDSTICRHDTVHFRATVTGGPNVDYHWWVGSGTQTPTFPTADKANFDSSFSARGQYHIALMVHDPNGCIILIQKNNYITVGPPGISFRAVPPIGCAPVTIIFKDSSLYTPSTYAVSRWWDFGDGTSASTTAQSISHAYSNAGSYAITLAVVDNIGCTDTLGISGFLNIYKPQAIWSTTNTNACVNVPFNFFNSSTGNSLTYLWRFGDGTTSTTPSPSHAYAVTGTYSVTLIVTDAAGCHDSMVKTAYITVKGPPTAAFSMSDTLNICPPMVVNFTNNSFGAIIYNWSFGNTGSSVLTNPTSTYTTPGVYTIRLIATNNAGCHDTAFGRVRVLGYRGVLSYAPLFGCAPLTVTFHANNVQAVPGFIYDFDDGTPTLATLATTVTHTYYTYGPHVPRITMTDNLGCSALSIGLDTVKIDGVVAGYTYSPFPACGNTGGTFSFTDTSRSLYSGIATTVWTFHDGVTSTLSNPSHTYLSPANYNITLFHTTKYGCKDTLHSTFHLWPLPQVDAGRDTTICATDGAVLLPAGALTYEWSPAGSLSCASCENPVAKPVVRTLYTVTGTDGHGCSARDTVSVYVKTKVDATASGGREICSGDTVQLYASGGAQYNWSPPTALSRADTSSPRAWPIETVHYVLITRYASCIPDTDFVDIVVHPTPEVKAGPDVTMIAGTPVQLTVTGSAFVTAWTWTPELGLSCAHCTDPEAKPTHTTTYIITGGTEFGCRTSDSVTVFVVCDGSQVYLPNTFTPDGNGVNDVFYPRGRGVATVNSFRVYNRWGEVVFDRHDISIDDRAQGWEGKMNGAVLPPDVYVYIIEATCDTGEAMKFQGDVLLLR